MTDLPAIILAIALIVAAYYLGRLVQWCRDASDAMNSRRRS